MSTKTSFKRIALVAASALALAGFSAVPANAAAAVNTLSTLAASAQTVAALAPASTTFTLTTTGTATSTATWTASVVGPVGSTATPIFSAPVVADTAFTYAAATATTFTANPVGLSGLPITAAGGGTISITPDLPGTYTVSIIGNGSGLKTPSVFVVTATKITASSIAKKSATSITNGTGTLVTNGTTAVTSGGTPFTADMVGKSLWSNGDGFIGTIAVVGANNAVTLVDATTSSRTAATTTWWVGTLAATTLASGIVANQIAGMTVTAGSLNALNISLVGVPAAASRAKIVIGGTNLTGTQIVPVPTADTAMILPFSAPIAAGTYSATVQISNAGTFLGTTADEIDLPFTLTVSAAASLSAASAIVLQAPSSTTGTAQGQTAPTNYSTTLDAAAYAARATVGTTISTVEVILLNNDQTAAKQLNTITASITGSGAVLVDETPTVEAATLRSSSLANTAGNNIMWVHLSTDGTTGPGTVTISVTDAVTGVTTTIGTKSFTSTGAVSKIAVSSSNFAIGAAGQTSGQTGARAVLTSTNDAFNTKTTATTPAFVVKATDSAGNATNIATVTGVPSITSSDLTVATGGTCVKDATTAAVAALIGQGGTTGFYNCSFTIAANAKSGAKATLTLKTADPADTTGATFLTATYAVSVGSTTIATETITTDSASYTAGSPMLVTVTAKDTAGNPVADGTASPALTANKALGTTAVALATNFYVGGSASNAASVAKSTLFAPSLGGDFLITGTSGNAAGSTITASATVEGDQSSSLALDAANAATDAANNAYDEAQNATQAASDALAAVTALSAQVSALIATVKSLAAMVAKIKAKVKA